MPEDEIRAVQSVFCLWLNGDFCLQDLSTGVCIGLFMTLTSVAYVFVEASFLLLPSVARFKDLLTLSWRILCFSTCAVKGVALL